MTQISIFVEIKETADSWIYGYILETFVRNQAVTRSGSGSSPTKERAVLDAATEAIGRIRRPCRLTVWIPEATVLGTLLELDELAAVKFFKKMRKVPHYKELEAIHASGHEMEFREGTNPYSKWINDNLLKGEKNV